jgi:hypothetical protein
MYTYKLYVHMYVSVYVRRGKRMDQREGDTLYVERKKMLYVCY